MRASRLSLAGQMKMAVFPKDSAKPAGERQRGRTSSTVDGGAEFNSHLEALVLPGYRS